MAERYIGIENELTSFDRGEVIDFEYSHSFKKVRRKKDYEISDTSVRTEKGLGFYCDGAEIEILTPPIAINKGFATRLTDALMIGRDHILKSTPDLVHTGYSMHWNLSEAGETDYMAFFRIAGIPFSMFSKTPLSHYGAGVRKKGESEKRIELLGDSINNEEQILATALLLGAASQAIRTRGASENFESKIPGFYSIPTNDRFINIKNRGCLVDVVESGRNGRCGIVTAQEYLEKFYEWLKPAVNELGSQREVQTLEDFVTGARMLEIDKEEEYGELEDDNLMDEGMYLPPKDEGKYKISPVLKPSRKRRELPVEAKLLGMLVKSYTGRIEEMQWDKAEIHLRKRESNQVEGILRRMGNYRVLVYEYDDSRNTLVANSTRDVYELCEATAKRQGRDMHYERPLDLGNLCATPIKISFVDENPDLANELIQQTLLLQPSGGQRSNFIMSDSRGLFTRIVDAVRGMIFPSQQPETIATTERRRKVTL